MSLLVQFLCNFQEKWEFDKKAVSILNNTFIISIGIIIN
jgi:hypothetical protein